MGRGSPIERPSCSPDLTPRDYFLLRYIEESEFREPPRTIAGLKTKIYQIIQTVNQESLKNVFKNMKTQLNFVVRERAYN